VVGMKRTRRDLVRVGAFTLVAGAILAGSLLWIAGSRLLRSRDVYEVIFAESVSGLSAGSQVEYQGVVVGTVRDIRLTKDLPPRVSVIVALEPSTPVRRDTRASLLGSFVTGIQYIELQGGTEEAPPLPPGGVIPGNVPFLAGLQSRAVRAAELVLDILTRLDRHVFTESNAERMTSLITDLGVVATRLRTVSEMFEGEEAGRDVAQMLSQVTQTARSVEAVFDDFYARRERVYGSLTDAIEELDTLLADVRTGTGGAEGIAALGGDVRDALERVNEVLDVIEADPSVLLRGRRIPERELAE
jgi:phospholipid/cholesterol/gamma-HCH transport system substrate-binding protein